MRPVAHIQESHAVSEHEPAIDLPAVSEAVTAPPFAAPPGERVPDFTLERPRDPDWYKRAVFYEVLTRCFHDANGDGTGDMKGLTACLDDFEWVAIDCIWLLPIYESPLRDGGYDIADYLRILPEYGNIADFVELVEEAH